MGFKVKFASPSSHLEKNIIPWLAPCRGANFFAKKFMFTSRWGFGAENVVCWENLQLWILWRGPRLMQKLWNQLVNTKHDAMLTLLTPKMDPFSREAFEMTAAACLWEKMTFAGRNSAKRNWKTACLYFKVPFFLDIVAVQPKLDSGIGLQQ